MIEEQEEHGNCLLLAPSGHPNERIADKCIETVSIYHLVIEKNRAASEL